MLLGVAVVLVEVGENFFPNLQRRVADAASQSVALQDTPVDIAEENAAVGGATIVALSKSTLSRLAEHKSEVGPMSVAVQLTH